MLAVLWFASGSKSPSVAGCLHLAQKLILAHTCSLSPMSPNFDSRLTLSILRNHLPLTLFQRHPLGNSDTLSVYRGCCMNKVLQKIDVQLFNCSKFRVR